MKRQTYTINSMTPDGVYHDMGFIVFEDNRKVRAENTMLESQERRNERIERLSNRCKIEEGYG